MNQRATVDDSIDDNVVVISAPGDDHVAADDDDRALRALTVAELVDRPIPRWTVRNVFLAVALAVIFGASGSAKTFLMLDLAFAIARGQRWFGRRVTQGGVIYVAGEGHLSLRVRAYLEAHKLTPDDVPLLRVIPNSINLLRDDGDTEALVSEIRRVAREMDGVMLVVLDTLNSMMGGGDENASDDMGRMIAAARRIMDAIDCGVAYVHHSGKDESKGSRGHSSLKAAVDLEIQITGDRDRVAEAVKIRDGEPGQQFPFRLEKVDLGPDPDPEADEGDRLSSCVVVELDAVPVKPKKPIRRVVALDALREAISEFGERLPETSTIPPNVKAVTLDQWRTRWVLRTGYDDATDRSVRTNFDKDRRDLLASGLIGISKPHVWLA